MYILPIPTKLISILSFYSNSNNMVISNVLNVQLLIKFIQIMKTWNFMNKNVSELRIIFHCHIKKQWFIIELKLNTSIQRPTQWLINFTLYLQISDCSGIFIIIRLMFIWDITTKILKLPFFCQQFDFIKILTALQILLNMTENNIIVLKYILNMPHGY